MKAYQLKQDLYWAGVLDKNLRVLRYNGNRIRYNIQLLCIKRQ